MWNKKSSAIELVTQSNFFLFFDFESVSPSVTFFFHFRVSNWKVEKQMLNLRVSNSKFNLIFYEIELVTQKKISVKIFEIVTPFHNSIS